MTLQAADLCENTLCVFGNVTDLRVCLREVRVEISCQQLFAHRRGKGESNSTLMSGDFSQLTISLFLCNFVTKQSVKQFNRTAGK